VHDSSNDHVSHGKKKVAQRSISQFDYQNFIITMGDSGEESSNATAIKTMQLYSHVDRIWNELSELGYDRNDSDAIIPAKVVNMFDCYNYSGPEGAKRAAQLLCVSESSRVLDIGI
jgi:hypothetical protein